jgi:hypothetical protein
MKNLLCLIAISISIIACEKNTDVSDTEYIARIVAFDMNCSTCILEFPDNSEQVNKIIGPSPQNFYHAVNMGINNYEPGQKVKIKIRSAEPSDLRACLTLYPSFNYENLVVTNITEYNNLIFNDTVDIAYKDCLFDPGDQMYICFDSIVNDSRCPPGVTCIWEGNAEVRLTYENNNKKVFFNLNTHRMFTTDTIIDNYKFSLIGLSSTKSYENRTDPKNFYIRIIVSKE